MSDYAKVARLVFLGTTLSREEFATNPEAIALGVELDLDTIDREKGRDPVGWLLDRIDVSGIPGARIWRDPISRERATLEWYPGGPGPCGGKPYMVVDDREPVPVLLGDAQEFGTVRTRLVTPELTALPFSVSERGAWEATDSTLRMVVAQLERTLGARPKTLTDRELAERRGIVQGRPAPEKGE